MSKQPIEKQDFYPELISMMDQAQNAIHFYSISCCFGFYSKGLANFEKVFLAIRDRLSKIHAGRYLDVRILIKIDHENPIDTYAAERLAQLESRYAHTGDENYDRNVFRELSSEVPSFEAVQFLIVDGNNILISETQEEIYNEELDLVLNKSQRGKMFEKSDYSDEFGRYERLFEKTWNESAPLDIEVRYVSSRKLRYFLERYKGVHRAKNERDLHLLLTGYLQGLFDPSIVDFEATVGATRIDLLVGRRPHHLRHGIEVKFQADNNAINGIVGQIRDYRKEYEHLILIVGQPKYTPQKRLDLVNELKEIDVGLIEIK